MKKSIVILAGLIAALASCSPSAYVLDLEMRYPSASGDDFTGKDMGVVYLQKPDRSDSAKVFARAEAIAKTIEKDYFNSKPEIPLYSVIRKEGGNYSAVDTLVALVMETGKDVVFLVDGPAVHYYDSFGDGKVKSISSSSPQQLASVWKNESYTILYYEENTWIKALEYAVKMEWQKASDEWVYIAGINNNNMQKRSCAEYNIALACYMVGNYDLAMQWLEASDKDYPVSLSAGLRRRIINRMVKKAGQ